MQILKPGQVNRIELKGKSKAGINTVITCYVFDWGPELKGSRVEFEIAISCDGGVPAQLGATLDMFWLYLGEFQQVPGSVTRCRELNRAFLGDCVSRGPCFQAGNYYDGLADLFAYDELGDYHQATLYAPARFITCVV